jgi:RNA polymerase sigma factor (sigma-70 family)
MNRVIQHLWKAVLVREGADRTDGQLLEGFVSRRETAALEVLVHRHAPMVWGVCRRILANHHDAEDAFQATFIVLVRKAATILPREMVASWLYGVARQTALRARAAEARRQGRERQVQTMPEAAVEQEDPWRDLQPLLDEELSRLPDRYRLAIILCDLEGKTRKEAARQLGCPEGTLAARVARGRALLARRLAQRGVIGSGAALAGVLAQQAASAGVPAAVVDATIETVTQVVTGQAATGLISARVAILAEGVIKMMLLAKLKTILGTCLVVGLLLGLGLAYHALAADRAPAAPPEKPAPAADKTPPALCDNNLRDTLLVLDKQQWDAASNHDVDTLAKILAHDLIIFSPTGQHWNRERYLQRCRESRYINVKFPTGKEVIRMNEHTAIMTYEVVWGADDKGIGPRPGLNHDRMISCWVQRDGGWFLRYVECVNRVNFPDRREPAAPPTPLKERDLRFPLFDPALRPVH